MKQLEEGVDSLNNLYKKFDRGRKFFKGSNEWVFRQRLDGLMLCHYREVLWVE